jgi:hypothetical protein
LDAAGDELGRQVAKSETYRLGLAENTANLRRHEVALDGLIRALRDDAGRCRLCSAVASQVHLPECPVSVAVDITHPEYRRAALVPATPEKPNAD